jgi:hypothetical protein
MLEVDEGRQPPFTIRLAPWATACAEELHQQFGDDIELTVGALPYPPGRQPPRPPDPGPPPDLLDPHTGEVVGGFAGFQTLPLIIFRVAPGQTERVPLLIGTASRTPRLGYTIPPGDWGIQATLSLGPHPRDSPRRRTPILPLTVTRLNHPPRR